MTGRLLLDEMYPPALADLLCQCGHDVVAVAARADLMGLDDVAVLDAATVEERCLVTENVCDFAVLARQAGHGGVLFVHGQRWPRTRTGIHRLATALDHALAEKQVPGPDTLAWLT
ncbi:MAG TPA: DUF5615 family PIN-like protein [Pseudonocardiaceae bacterium]|nr:DUF5615 family PIN-like protein [Pseudonocardiaceae bacterium]